MAQSDLYTLHLDRADLLLDLGRSKAALQEARRAIGLDAQRASGWFEASRAFLAMEDGAEALNHAAAGLARAPRSSWGHRLRSTALTQLGRHTEALEAADHAIQLSPQEPLALRRRARCLYMLDRDDEALQLTQEAIEHDPENPYGYSLRGDILFHNSQLEAAEAAFREALRHAPERASILRRLGDVLRRQRRYEAAIDAYHGAVRMDPTDARARDGFRRAFQVLESQLRLCAGCTVLSLFLLAAGLFFGVLFSLGMLPMVLLLGSACVRLRRMLRKDPAAWALWQQLRAESRG